MKEIKPEEINDNFIKLIGSEWMLVTAGDKSDFNMMTASWGGAGVLWARPVVTIYVRPERYTHEYIEKSNRFTLTFSRQQCAKHWFSWAQKVAGPTTKCKSQHFPPLNWSQGRLPLRKRA